MAIRSPRVVARWRTIRSLYERGMPAEELAELAEMKEETILIRARKGGWQVEKPATRDEAAGRIARQMEGLLRAIDQAEGRFDKARTDALTARLRMLERLSELNRERTVDQQEQEETDAEIADILRQIDERILQFARQYADDASRDQPAETPGAAGAR